MKSILAIICAVFPLISAAQWSDISKEEFGNLISAMDNKNSEKRSFSYTAIQSFFDSPESIDTFNRMNFSYHYVDELGILNMHQFNTLFVQDSLISIRIDSVERILLIEKANTDLARFNPNRNFSEFYKSSARVQKNTKSKETIYNVKFDTLALFSNLKIWVNSNGDITKYSLIGGKPISDNESEEQRFIYPRLDVSISNIKYGNDVTKNKLISPSYFFTDRTYTKLKDEFSDYEVMDTRNKKE
jgi:hypothetical protein